MKMNCTMTLAQAEIGAAALQNEISSVSDNAMMDLCCEYDETPNPNIGHELEELLQLLSRPRRVLAAHSIHEMVPLSSDYKITLTSLPAPRRYPRRLWIGLAQRLSTASSLNRMLC
jgi:hypothetical protein